MVKHVIILGDPLYKSDAGYVNYGFMNAFKASGYMVCCMNDDNKNRICEMGTTGNMYIINDTNNNEIIPLDQSNYYVLIKYSNKKFLDMRNKLVIKEYSTDIAQWRLDTYTNLGNNIYQNKWQMVMPWGSLLTPVEIMNNLKNFVELKDRECIFMTRDYTTTMLKQANSSDTKVCLKKMISLEDEKELLRGSKFSCCLTTNQKIIDYKVLTHLSYGIMVATDCQMTHEYLGSKTLYIDDITNLKSLTDNYYDSFKKNDLFDLMENISSNHTFVNRVKIILDYFGLN